MPLPRLRHIGCALPDQDGVRLSARLDPFLLQWGLALLCPEQEVSPRVFRSNTPVSGAAAPSDRLCLHDRGLGHSRPGVGQKELLGPALGCRRSRELKL